MANSLIRRNAIKHYQMKGGVPVWNPSLAQYFVLKRTALFGILTFRKAYAGDWAKLATAGKRKASKLEKELQRFLGINLQALRAQQGAQRC